MTSLQSGLVLGQIIGAGHYGEVLLGSDPIHGDVAVKRLTAKPNETIAAWSQRKTGLLEEGQRLKLADHPNVVKVISLLEDPANNGILLVLELCKGGSLQSKFDAGPMLLGEIRRVATEVTFGLQSIHARGMIHRDIKPANILLDEAGRAKIADFGLVTDDIILGYAGNAGYWDHLAIEFYQGRGTSVKTDIWALGMTIYRLLHGKDWYERSPKPKLSIAEGGFAKKLQWLPHVPAKWRRFIRSCMHDDSDLRFQSCDQVLSALASLPVEPNWQCSVSGLIVEWKKTVGDRRHTVTWTTHGVGKHEWSAVSEPTGEGRKKKLGGSCGILGKADCDRELCGFFS
jgi:eukaryotic-like serine/threonine-protein kinase